MILALFFTRGMSLRRWVESGLFEREKLIYEEHLNKGNLQKVIWITYGSDDLSLALKLQQEGRLHAGVDVLPMPKAFKGYYGTLSYSFTAPMIHARQLAKADILKTNQMDGAWTAVIAKKMFRKPLIVRTGYMWSSMDTTLNPKKLKIRFRSMVENLSYHITDVAEVAGPADAKLLVSRYGVPESKIHILPNYVDTRIFRPRPGRKYRKRLVFVGRLSHQKNLANLLTAAGITGFGVDIYGTGPLRPELESLVKTKGLNVRFHAPIPNSEIAIILGKYRFFILPSLFEGTPKSLIEAMACGLVCLGTDVPGTRDLLTDGETGLLARGTDVDAIVQVLERAESLGPKELKRISTNAVSKVVKSFSLEESANKEKEIFSELVV